MNDPISALPPPESLAITYTPADIRPKLRWLLIFDQRLLSVLQRAHEPMIAQLRLSWWRDALNAPAQKRPKGEPLLAELGLLEPDDILPAAALSMLDAYEILATEDNAQTLKSARLMRVHALVQSYGKWAALSDDGAVFLDQLAGWWTDSDTPQPKSLPKLLRPLSILALAEHLEQSRGQSGLFGNGLRLSWHALTGR